MRVRVNVRYYVLSNSRWDDHTLNILIGLNRRFWQRTDPQMSFESMSVARISASGVQAMVTNLSGATFNPLNNLGLSSFAASYEQRNSIACLCLDSINRDGSSVLGLSYIGRGVISIVHLRDMGRATIVLAHEQLHALNQEHQNYTVLHEWTAASWDSTREDMYMPRSYSVPRSVLDNARAYALSSGLGSTIP